MSRSPPRAAVPGSEAVVTTCRDGCHSRALLPSALRLLSVDAGAGRPLSVATATASVATGPVASVPACPTVHSHGRPRPARARPQLPMSRSNDVLDPDPVGEEKQADEMRRPPGAHLSSCESCAMVL